MTDQIVKITDIHAKAERDHAAGLAIDDHGFNWHALCLPTYLAERERLAEEQPSTTCHTAPAGRQRVDHRKGGAA